MNDRSKLDADYTNYQTLHTYREGHISEQTPASKTRIPTIVWRCRCNIVVSSLTILQLFSQIVEAKLLNRVASFMYTAIMHMADSVL